jgi:hypothetical protein
MKVAEPDVVVPVPVPEAVTVKLPVVFAHPPVPLVMAMVPGPLSLGLPARIPANSDTEAVNVPVSVPVVLPVVTVRVIGTLPEIRLVKGALALKVPLAVRPPEKARVPEAETLVPLVVPDPLIVMVVFTV